LAEVYGSRARAEAYPAALVRRIEHELRLADVVLAPSRFVVDGMVRYGVPPEKIELIPYGVDLTRFTLDESVHRPPTPRRPRLIFVGQISFRKGVPLLLDAVRGLDVDVTLVGQIFERSAVSDLPANVTLAGVLAPAELSRAYNAHDAMVLPTVDDACSLVVAEAAATGLRVLTTDANGAAELLPARHLVVPAGNVDALRSAMSELRPLSHEERREAASELRAGGESTIRAWDSYAEDVFQVLDARVEIHRRLGTAVGA
jgi:glycosyltransferase involved in cell wall biosynthesis